MRVSKRWAALGAGVMAVVLSACGGNGDSTSSSNVRVINATNSHASVDLLVGGVVAAPATATDTVSAYASATAGSVALQVNDAGGGTALSTIVPTLTGGADYALLAYESGGTVKTVILSENTAAPSAGAATLRVFDAAIESGKLDVYITAPTADLATVASPTVSFGTLSAAASTTLTYSPGTYRVRVTGSGDKSDLRLDMPSVTLTSQEVATVALTPASGSILLNGATLVQQGAYAAVRNTNTRVRLAAAVSGGGAVSASATSGATVTPIEQSSVAPSFGYYALVPAGAALNISVNGQSVGAPATALVAGGDVTLLVYGSSAAPTASLITDDNRPPTDTSTVKLRLINGITGNVGSLTLTANSAPVGNGTQPGTASSYVAVPGSVNAMNLSLFSSQNAGTLLTTSTTLNQGLVYSVLAGGDVSAPQLLIR